MLEKSSPCCNFISAPQGSLFIFLGHLFLYLSTWPGLFMFAFTERTNVKRTPSIWSVPLRIFEVSGDWPIFLQKVNCIPKLTLTLNFCHSCVTFSNKLMVVTTDHSFIALTSPVPLTTQHRVSIVLVFFSLHTSIYVTKPSVSKTIHGATRNLQSLL